MTSGISCKINLGCLRRLMVNMPVASTGLFLMNQYFSYWKHSFWSCPCAVFVSQDEFPVNSTYPAVLKWRRKPSAPSVSSSLPDLLGNSSSSGGNPPFVSETQLHGTTPAQDYHGTEYIMFFTNHTKYIWMPTIFNIQYLKNNTI